MNKLRVNKVILSICACMASINGELGLPLCRQLRILDSVTLIWSCIILATSLAKFFSKDLALNITRDANFKTKNEPTVQDILTINYLPRINMFEKLYYGLVSVSIGTSLIWRIYLRFYRSRLFAADLKDAKRSLMRFFYEGPPSGGALEQPEAGFKRPKSAALLSSVAHLEWVKLFECQAVINDVAGCSQELVRSLSVDSADALLARRLDPLMASHVRCKLTTDKRRQQQQPEMLAQQQDTFSNPLRSGNFLLDYTWLRWHYISRNVLFMLLFIGSMTVPILYFTIAGLYSVMRNFSYEHLDSKVKLALFYYGIMEQVYACTQAALFFIFTNVFIIIFHADIQFKMNTIERDLRHIDKAIQRDYQQAATTDSKTTELHRPPKILIYFQQFRLWAFFDHINQVDDFVSKYSVVSMSTFIVGLSFGQSFLRVEEPSLRRGTAAVLISNFLSFTFLYVISWDIERRSNRLHSTLLSIAARDSDFLIKRLWLKTLFGFFERDGKRTFTLADKYPLNLHSYFKTMFGWLTASLLINRLFHKPLWESTFG